MRLLRLGHVPLWLVLASAVATAQSDYYGKNKVQTRDYDWHSLETEHFDILFYPGGEALAEFAARAAEEFYDRLSSDLDVELEIDVPLILYLSPGQFAETNVITEVIEEGVGGFSELFKNRIVVPFNGSYSDFYHVIGHELTHIFEFQMFFRSRLSSLLGAVGEFQMPLWVTEGFAEFQSGWVNISSDAFMRDLLISDRLVSLTDLNDEYGYLAYREGESFFRYVEEKYGREKVFEFMHALRSKRNLGAAFNAVFGQTQEKTGEGWRTWLRVRYWPQVGAQAATDRLTRRLTDHARDGSVYNTAPALSASGVKVALVSDRSEYADCYVVSALDGAVLKRLVRGGRSGGFENMHLMRPGVDWSPDETVVAVVASSAGLDNIALVEYPSGRVLRRIHGGLDGICNPRFSPDGRRLAFVGLKNGFSDLYAVAVDGGEPARLTYDMYEERDPAFSPGGDSVAFVSDRPDPGEAWVPGRYAVWLRDRSGTLFRLTGRGSGYAFPAFAHTRPYLLYVEAESVPSICVYSLPAGRVERRCDFTGGVSHLSVSRDDRRLAFACYTNVGWDIAVLEEPLDSIPADTGVRAGGPAETAVFEKVGLDFGQVRAAPFRLSVDYAAGAASYSGAGGSGLAGTLNVAFSDMLGNHRFEVYTDLYGNILSSNGLVQYWLLPYRADFGFALFQYREYPYYNPYLRIVERLNRGGQATAALPFNRFFRVEAGLTAYAGEVTQWTPDYSRPDGWLKRQWWERTFSVSGATVFDNTLWTEQGPTRGTRIRVEAGSSFLSDSLYQLAYADLRDYQRIGRRFVFASRLLAAGSFGDADRFYLGGEDIRGYNWGEFYDRQGTGLGLFSLEFRYPFIDRLKLAFPLPLDIRGVRGVAFLDGGLVLGDSMKFWDVATGRPHDLKLGAGAGLRIQVSVLYLKLDFARPLSATDDDSWKFIFGLGSDF